MAGREPGDGGVTYWEVIETQTIRTWYLIEAESQDDALERYQRGEFNGNDILETLVSAKPVKP